MPGMDSTDATTADELMQLVRKRYLGSRDFNGLHLHGSAVAPSRAAAIELLKAGLVQVVSDADYMNIHIRPWKSRRSDLEQLQDLTELSADDYGVCLYPLAAGMKGVRLPRSTR